MVLAHGKNPNGAQWRKTCKSYLLLYMYILFPFNSFNIQRAAHFRQNVVRKREGVSQSRAHT